jgi:hypothetical protein
MSNIYRENVKHVIKELKRCERFVMSSDYYSLLNTNDIHLLKYADEEQLYEALETLQSILISLDNYKYNRQKVVDAIELVLILSRGYMKNQKIKELVDWFTKKYKYKKRR